MRRILVLNYSINPSLKSELMPRRTSTIQSKCFSLPCHSILKAIGRYVYLLLSFNYSRLFELFPKGRSWSSAWTCTVNGNVSLSQTCISAQHATVNHPRRSRRDGSEVRWLRTNLHTTNPPSTMSAIVFPLSGYRYIIIALEMCTRACN